MFQAFLFFSFSVLSQASSTYPRWLYIRLYIRQFPYRTPFIPIQLTQAVLHCHNTVPIARPTAMVGHGADGEVTGTAVWTGAALGC